MRICWVLPLVLLMPGCVKKGTTTIVRDIGEPVEVMLPPELNGEVVAINERGEGLQLDVALTHTELVRITQEKERFLKTGVTQESASKASRAWLISAGVSAMAIGGLLAPFAVRGDFDGVDMIQPMLVVASPSLAIAGIQSIRPWLPGTRENFQTFEDVHTARGETVSASQVRIGVYAGGTALASGHTDDLGSAVLSLTMPEAGSLTVSAEAWRETVSLDHLSGWRRARHAQIRRLVMEPSASARRTIRALLPDPTLEAARPPEDQFWTTYCSAYLDNWGADWSLNERTVWFNALQQTEATDLAACGAVWRALDAAWAEALLPEILDDPSYIWPMAARSVVESEDLAPALRGLQRCAKLLPAALKNEDDLIQMSTQAEPTIRQCASHGLSLAEAERAEIARQQQRCESAKSKLRPLMRQMTKVSYADRLGSRIRSTRDSLVVQMETIARRGGPTHEEQAWVECVAYALQSGTDLMNNIYEIDYGGHSEEWVEHGQFNWRQEGALSQLVEPGEQCRSFVRRGIGSSMVSSIERYLQLSEALGEVCQEQ